MSRRKANTITVTDWPKLRRGQLYLAKVKSISVHRASNGLQVTLEHTNPTQGGRLQHVKLPCPRPGNQTHAFLAAGGVTTLAPGDTIDLDQLVGRLIGFRLRGQETEPGAFVFEKVSDPSAAETTVPATESSGTERSESETTTVDQKDEVRTY